MPPLPLQLRVPSLWGLRSPSQAERHALPDEQHPNLAPSCSTSGGPLAILTLTISLVELAVAGTAAAGSSSRADREGSAGSRGLQPALSTTSTTSGATAKSTEGRSNAGTGSRSGGGGAGSGEACRLLLRCGPHWVQAPAPMDAGAAAVQVLLPLYHHHCDVSLLLCKRDVMGTWRAAGRLRVRLYGLLPLLVRARPKRVQLTLYRCGGEGQQHVHWPLIKLLWPLDLEPPRKLQLLD